MLTAAALVLAQLVFTGAHVPVSPTRCVSSPPLPPPCSSDLDAGTACVTVMSPEVSFPPCGPDVVPGTPCLWNGREIVLRSRTGHGARASIIFGAPPAVPGFVPHVRGGYVFVRLEVGPDDCATGGAYRDLFEGAIGLGQAPCWE